MDKHQRLKAEINLDALEKNFRNIRKKVPENVDIMAVVKADAYGHGAIECSRLLINAGASRLGVATIEEALELRRAGISEPILILGYIPEREIPCALAEDITLTVYSKETALKISNAAKEFGKYAKIHIKIDSGMGRIGFMPDEKGLLEVYETVNLPYIEPEGIFTHFATADEADKEFTKLQAARFTAFIDRLKEKGVSFPVIHAANSAGIIDFENLYFNMARAGIILYGLYPSGWVKKENLALFPVMSIKSVVSHVKKVPKGTPISYGRRFVTEAESVMATIPAGYADGYIRKMSNGGRVIIKGRFAPVRGTICMDQFMVDVTDIADVSLGDEVILMGGSGKNYISADELAKIQGSISYEVTCLIGKRVPRVYIKNGTELKTTACKVIEN